MLKQVCSTIAWLHNVCRHIMPSFLHRSAVLGTRLLSELLYVYTVQQFGGLAGWVRAFVRHAGDACGLREHLPRRCAGLYACMHTKPSTLPSCCSRDWYHFQIMFFDLLLCIWNAVGYIVWGVGVLILYVRCSDSNTMCRQSKVTFANGALWRQWLLQANTLFQTQIR